MKTYFPTYIIWLDDIAQLLQIFDKTVLKCDQIIEVGIYNTAAKFFFIMNQKGKHYKRFVHKR